MRYIQILHMFISQIYITLENFDVQYHNNVFSVFVHNSVEYPRKCYPSDQNNHRGTFLFFFCKRINK